LRRVDVPGLRAALWALRALIATRRDPTKNPAQPPSLPRVPRLPPVARRGVEAVLRRRAATCLERATLLQAWYAAQGRRRDVVIGVTAPNTGFRAHAWLDGDPPCHEQGFHELLRRPLS
jgi:hypothetical protein